MLKGLGLSCPPPFWSSLFVSHFKHLPETPSRELQLLQLHILFKATAHSAKSSEHLAWEISDKDTQLQWTLLLEAGAPTFPILNGSKWCILPMLCLFQILCSCIERHVAHEDCLPGSHLANHLQEANMQSKNSQAIPWSMSKPGLLCALASCHWQENPSNAPLQMMNHVPKLSKTDKYSCSSLRFCLWLRLCFFLRLGFPFWS
jgi:hypothetical protein